MENLYRHTTFQLTPPFIVDYNGFEIATFYYRRAPENLMVENIISFGAFLMPGYTFKSINISYIYTVV